MSEQSLIIKVVGKADYNEEYFNTIINELENSKSIFKNIDIMVLKVINLFYDKEEKEFNFKPHLDKYKRELLCFFIDLKERKILLNSLENYLSKLDKYGIIFQVFQKSSLANCKFIYYFFDLLKNESKTKEIINKILSNRIILEIKYNINLEELIQSIIDSKCLKDNECNFFDLYNTIQKRYEITEINNTGSNEKISTLKDNKRKKKKKYTKQDEEKKKDKKEIENKEVKKIDDKKENQLEEINQEKKEETKTEKKVEYNNSAHEKYKELMNNTFQNYFKKRQEYYKKKNIETPILDKIVYEKTMINTELFAFKINEKDYDIEPYNNVLKNVIEYFKSESVDESKIGYVCYKDKDQVVEAIYATLPNLELYNEITNKRKYKQDEFGDSSKEIRDSYFKARGLSFEYFINSLLMETFKFDELPRAFFRLKNQSFTKNDIDHKNEEINKKKELSMDELDGTFFCQQEVNLNLKALSFIEDYKLEVNPEINNKFYVTFSDADLIKFYKNSLILIEVKNSFPYYNKEDDKEEKEKKEKEIYDLDIISLKKELIIFLKKAEVFYQKYKENFEEINKVQLIFFYDSVRKKGYEGILQKSLNEFFSKKTFIPPGNLELQFISILSSYFAIAVYDLREKIKLYEIQAKELQGRVNFFYDLSKELKIENDSLSNKIETLSEEVENLKTENKTLSAEMEKMKTRMDAMEKNI